MGRGERERTVTVVSIVVTTVVIAAYVAFGDSPVSTRVRAMLGADERLRPAVSADGEGPYAFLNTQPGGDRPVGFSPCQELRYVVNPEHAPDGWEGFVARAVDQLSDSTGLELAYEGTTTDRDFERMRGGSPEPVIIAWADEEEVSELADDVAGIGGPTMVELGRMRAYVSGSVILDSDTTDRFAEERGGDDLQVALLLHELGHLVGLDHVDDPGELMYGEGITRPDYGPGDRRGLARLGAIPCR